MLKRIPVFLRDNSIISRRYQAQHKTRVVIKSFFVGGRGERRVPLRPFKGVWVYKGLGRVHIGKVSRVLGSLRVLAFALDSVNWNALRTLMALR